MRVAVLGEYEPHAAEGMAIVTRSVARALTDVGVATMDLSAHDAGAQKPPRLLKKAILARRFGADAIEYVPKSGLTAASLARAALLRTLTGAPVVFLCLQADERLPNRMPRYLLPDAFIAPSLRLADQLAAFGLPVHVVELGVDASKFCAVGRRAVDMWPARPGLRVLHVGHLTPRRNLDVIASLARAGHNCLVIGSPSTPADPGVSSMLISAGVEVVHDAVADISSVYRAADFYVFPVQHRRGCIEMPLSVIEAAACGTPVVSVSFGGVAELAAKYPLINVVRDGEMRAAVAGTDRRPSPAHPPDWSEVARAHARILSRTASGRRRGALVVLLGIDGTGKSTQAKLLVDEARRRGMEAATVWSRWDPLLLRPLIRAARRATSEGAPTADREATHTSFKRKVFRHRAVRRAWEVAASVDHGTRAIPRLAVARRRAELVIADRYFHDALIDMGVNYGGAPPPPRGLFRFFPKADGVIVLDAPEEVAFARKADVPSIEYLRARRALYLELAAKNDWPVVDAGSTAETVHARLIELVLGPRS